MRCVVEGMDYQLVMVARWWHGFLTPTLTIIPRQRSKNAKREGHPCAASPTGHRNKLSCHLVVMAPAPLLGRDLARSALPRERVRSLAHTPPGSPRCGERLAVRRKPGIYAAIFDLDLSHWKDDGMEPSQTKLWLGRRVPTSRDKALGHRRRVRVARRSRSSKSNGPDLAGYPVGRLPRGLLAQHGTASEMLHEGERRDYRGQHISTRAENGRKSLQRRT